MKRRTDAVVGLVIVLAGLLVFFGTVWLRGGSFGREEVIIEARFGEIGQLLRGNPVKVRGVPIGRVAGIALEEGGDAVIVTMRIESGVALPAEPVVLLSPQSMFGDWQAEIHPRGEFPRFDYAESLDPQILPGYALPDLSRLTPAADQIADNLASITDRVEIAFTEETALNVRRAIENIQEVSEQLTGLVGSQQRTMDGIAAGLAETTRTMGEAAETVRRAFERVDVALAEGELTAIVDNMVRATAQVDSLAAVLLAASGEFRSTVGRADHAVASFQSMATELNDGQGTLGLLLQDSVLYYQLVESNEALQALLKDIRDNPRKYIRLRIFGN